MQDVDDPRLRECLAAFASRDYTACYVAAIRDSAQPLDSGHPVFRQLVAICLQRLGQAADLEALPRLLLDAAADPWEKSLIRLTFGRASLDLVWPAATDDERRCQARLPASPRDRKWFGDGLVYRFGRASLCSLALIAAGSCERAAWSGGAERPRSGAAARANAASLNLAASCQPVIVTFSSRTGSCPLNVAELL